MEWSRYRWMVEEWTILGDRRRFSTSIRCVPRFTKSISRGGYKLHSNIKSRGWWRILRALCIQMDNTSHSTNHIANNNHYRSCCWHFQCYKQWVWIMGGIIWEAVFYFLGDCSSLSILERTLGRHNRTPTIIIVWSILVASIFSLLWVRIDPFLAKSDGPILEECGLDCN